MRRRKLERIVWHPLATRSGEHEKLGSIITWWVLVS
jgi:hypothetical protein